MILTRNNPEPIGRDCDMPVGSDAPWAGTKTSSPVPEIIRERANGARPLSNGWKVVRPAQPPAETTILGNSPMIKRALNLTRKASATRSTVLLLGESGTGKENFAHTIHAWSARRHKPFVAINCVGLSKELLESELFGHEKGAFTGAHQAKQGKIELANGGTIFLDEIGDIAPEIQTKLLRFLQERRFERVGGTSSIDVDVRIIAATNRNLEKAVQEGTFRLDLYFRLNVVPIELPPLRERRDDIPVLAQYFLAKFAAETDSKSPTLTKSAADKLRAHNWPGNVRELANTIERAMVLTDDGTIDIEDLALSSTTVENPTEALESLPYHEAVHAFRKKIISRALEQEGSQVAAARALRLQKTYLCRLIKDLQIK